MLDASDDKIKQRIVDIEKESITHGTTGTIVLVTGDKVISFKKIFLSY